MSLERIEQTLKERIGLHAGTIGRTAISSAVGRRMAALDMTEVHSYCEYVCARPDELHQLIETVVIPETWFFRDGRPFEGLKRFARTRASRRLRALSVPCSTGEEPYSIAITLFEAGLDAAQFQVDAVDVSRRALEFAQAGHYGSHSFRGEQDAAVIQRYFRRDNTRLHIDERVRRQVRFSHGNLLEAAMQPSPGSYDAVFCRNLLIYFDDTTKQQAFRTLHRLLADDGILFVGHAECGSVPGELFHTAPEEFSFAFLKGPGAGRERAAAGRRTAAPARAAPAAAPKSVLRPAPPLPAPTPPPRPHATPLESARQLADLGRLQEAREICEAHLAKPAERAEAYFLMGVIHASKGDDQAAEQALRRALYLEPRHYEALVHLALVLQRAGDDEGARRVRQRAERACPPEQR